MTATAPAAITLVVGDEELLVSRAVAEVVLTVRGTVPDADVRDLAVSALVPGQLMELLTPSLFGERRVVALRDLQDAGKDAAAHLASYAADPLPEVALVAVHSGAARNKPLLTSFRDAAGCVVDCAKVTRPAERSAFLAAEVRRAGREITSEAVTALLDAVGTDLRELATAAGQLVADTTGPIDEPVVARYHRGRAEVTGFLVADRAVEGDLAGAIEALRWAEEMAIAPVLVNSAVAGNLRAIARVAGSGRGNAYSLARSLGMPAWKVERAQRWARAWTPDGLRTAVLATADADAAVKGGAADAQFALEQAIRRVAAARSL